MSYTKPQKVLHLFYNVLQFHLKILVDTMHWTVRTMLLGGKKALTMTCEKVDFQVHLYEKRGILFERSQKVI